MATNETSLANGTTKERTAGPWQVWRLLLVSNAFSMIGNYVQNLALPLWVLSVTGSYTATGITFAVGTLPVVLSAPIAGRIVDLWDRRHIFVGCELLCALIVIILIVAARSESLGAIYFLVAALKAVGSVSVPAVQALLKERVEPENVRPIVSLFEVVFGIAMSLGPLLGALLSARNGIEAALWLNFCSFIVAGLLGSFIRGTKQVSASPERSEPETRTILKALRWRDLDIRLRRVATAEASYFLFLGSEVVVVLATFEKSLGIGAAAVYQTLAGLGWIAGSYFFVRRLSSPIVTVCSGAAISMVAAGMLAMDGDSWSWAAVVAVGLLGGTGNVMIAGGATIAYQILTTKDIIGRIFAFRRAVLNLLMTISYITVPFIADVTERPVAILVFVGAVNLAITATLLVGLLLKGSNDDIA